VVGNVPLTTSTEIPGALVYRAKGLNELPAPRCIYIPDTQVYNGPNAQYENVDEQQKGFVAKLITYAFRQEIGRHQRLCQTPGPGGPTLQLTLFGLKRTTPTEISPTVPYGWAIAASDLNTSGMEVAINDSMTLGGKLSDSDGKVLGGFVDTVSSSDFTLSSHGPPAEMARLGADKIAREIAQAVDREIARERKNPSG